MNKSYKKFGITVSKCGRLIEVVYHPVCPSSKDDESVRDVHGYSRIDLETYGRFSATRSFLGF
jgi:hypothetical protein